MKIEISEEGIVFCDCLPCSNFDDVDHSCDNCPIQKIISKAAENDPLVKAIENDPLVYLNE